MLRTIRITTAIVAGACAATFATPASADTRTTNLGVSASVTANCTISADPVAFGPVDTLSATEVLGTGAVNITCTNGTGWSAAANVGSGSGASYATRRMTRVLGTETMNYTLYRDAARTQVWGDGSSSTFTVTGTGSGSAQSFTVYGRVPGGQSGAPPGSYTDIVGVTITY